MSYLVLNWSVKFCDEFAAEMDQLPEDVADHIFAGARRLQLDGPNLGRPAVDTLRGSKYPNMKEFRFDAADGVWRIAFAFDHVRQAIFLVAGDKSGGSEQRFYRELIRKADLRFASYLASAKSSQEKSKGA